MPLEAVMICMDNSDYTRNGDYTPTRFEAQTDAVNLICGAKTQQNIENSVGILSTAGDRIEVNITPTSDLGKMVAELAKVKVGGSADLMRGIQTAQLALKHRQNKNQKQRIIAFVGSPITSTEKELESLGKNLKKNNVSLDLVSFGEVEENSAKLEKLLNAVNSGDTSHVLEVPVGPKLLSDVLLSSVIIAPEGAEGYGGAGGGGGGGDDYGLGINPNEDPELALALRISMEEERARQQQMQAAEGGGASTGDAGAAATPADGAAAPAAAAMPVATDAAVIEAMGMEDMDEELRQALMLSLQESGGAAPAAEPAPAASPAAAPAATPAAAPAPATGTPAIIPGMTAEEMADMDPELRQALLESMQDSQPAPAPAPAPAAAEASKDVEMKPAAAPAAADAPPSVDSALFQDASFVQELLGSLPGVDINDPRIQDALKEVGGNGDDKDKPAEGGDKSGGSSGGSGDAPK
eukprot:gnl/TRDRNA2_/TRDRNA2_154108_c1_seq3.p1 gnl/TRDRNA2_/TRDRNA2_154108_c1~~gnl/TRDRNA2_/TRDRNA2_154108_c1_seq3.p1  ORF type:complete len:467 (-),score=136.98 gnl/TRDRNA2_/TRDRNA2_154108_c1_seq3:229-1629(-)